MAVVESRLNETESFSEEIDPLTEFFSAITNPQTKKKYSARLYLFFSKVRIEGRTENEKARIFVSRAKKDSKWASHTINQYMLYQRARAESHEISESTLPNYLKPIKLFCEENFSTSISELDRLEVEYYQSTLSPAFDSCFKKLFALHKNNNTAKTLN